MPWLIGVTVLLKLIGLAEEGAAQSKVEGSVKKSAVTNFFMTLFGGIAATVTGGAADTVKEIEPVVGVLIDNIVAVANATGQLAGGKNVVVDDSSAFKDMPVTQPG